MTKIKKRKNNQRKLAKKRLAKQKQNQANFKKWCLELTSTILPELVADNLAPVKPMTEVKHNETRNL